MALTKVTDAAAELFTLAEARLHLRAPNASSEDALLNRLIKTVRLAAEEALHRTLINTTWKITLDAFPCVIRLERPPVSTISWIKYTDSNGDEQTLDAALYKVALAQEPGRIVPAYGQVWPTTRWEPEAVRVQYVAGYGAASTAVPAPILQWALTVLTDLYENRGRSSEDPVVPQAFTDQLLDGFHIWGA